MQSEPPDYARLEVPSWLGGGEPAKFLALCGYKVRTDGCGGYLVRTDESYRNAEAHLVISETLAGPGVEQRRLQGLAGLQEPIDAPMPQDIEVALERRKAKAEQTRQLVDVLNYERLRTYATPVEELPARAGDLLNLLRTWPAETAGARPVFAGAGLDVVRLDPVLPHRVKLASVWLRLGQDERLGQGDLAHITGVAQQQQVFASSAGLLDGVFTLDAYVAPLVAALAPGMWGVNVVRTFGSMVFSLGRCVLGTAGDAAELLQLISMPGADDEKPLPALGDGAASEATTWWARQLNRAFGVLSDPAVFTDRAGNYRADKHLQAMLTVEQIFRRTTSMLAACRDSNARRTLMFSVLDSVQRVNGWDLLTMFRLGHASSVLERLEDSMPNRAQDILLPTARQGVDALRRMQDGFFIRKQLGTDLVELRLPGAQMEKSSPEDAGASYLKLLRDATHGHGGKSKVAEQTAALLAHHDGHVPHDIGLLAYLYLLDMLANPQRLRSCLYRSGR